MKHILPVLFFLFPALTNAQTVCDSLDFVSIGYSPFTDSLIIVQVENHNSMEIFDYPGFVLIDNNGDTLAKESVFYFGIGQQSVHTLEVRPGVLDPLENFSGNLELFTGFFSEQACSWSLDQSFCPQTECDSLILGFQNWGGALVIGDFAWSLLDSTQTVIESGVLTMTANEQYWFRGFCLPHAQYSFSLYALGQPSGGGPTMTASANSWFSSPTLSMPMDWNSGNVLDIPFYLHCISESPNGIQQAEKASLEILRNGGRLSLRSNDSMKTVEVFSIDGKMIGSFNPNSSQFTWPLDVPTGLYLIRVETETGSFSQKVLF